MIAIILGLSISYLFVYLYMHNKIDIKDLTFKNLFQGAFIIFLFGGYWIALLILWIIELAFD